MIENKPVCHTPVSLQLKDVEGTRLVPPASSEQVPVDQWRQIPAKLDVQFHYDTFSGLGPPNHGPLVNVMSGERAFGFGPGGPYSEGIVDAHEFAKAIRHHAPIDFPAYVAYPGSAPAPNYVRGVYDSAEKVYQFSGMNSYGTGRWTYEVPREDLLEFAEKFPREASK